MIGFMKALLRDRDLPVALGVLLIVGTFALSIFGARSETIIEGHFHYHSYAAAAALEALNEDPLMVFGGK